MNDQRIRFHVFSAILLCGMAIGVPAAPRKATTVPIRTRPAKVTKISAEAEAWVSQIALDELKRSLGGDLTALESRMEAAILARLACGSAEQLSALNDLVYVRRACRYLRITEKLPAGGRLAAWLVENRKVSRLLFRALGDVSEPRESLERFQELLNADKEAVLEHPNLAVAFATAQPMRHYRRQPNPCTMLDSFRWYTSRKIKFRYNLREMPYELSRYLAGTRLSVPERQWVVKKYTRSPKLGSSFFDVKYDSDHFKKGKPKKIANLEYTLPNLRKVGGVCIEQAYYAAEVCKALGVPAAIVRGRGRSGIHHAWVAFLEVDRRGGYAIWDADTGRYEAQKYYTGLVREPAGWDNILDSELTICGMAAQLVLQRREEADAATVLAKLAEAAREENPAPDMTVLMQLAELYDQRFTAGGKTSSASTDWIRAGGEIDLSLVRDLLALGLERNLAHRPAWEFIIHLRKSGSLPAADLDRFFDVLISRTAKQYPDYSCVMVMRIVPTIEEPEIRQKVCRRAFGVYKRRPDLQGRIMLAMGDDYRKQTQIDKALKAYGAAATQGIEVPDVVMHAARNAEEILLDRNQHENAIQMYASLFRMTRRLARKSSFRGDTSHYKLGQRLAELLLDAGRGSEAAKVLKEIDRE